MILSQNLLSYYILKHRVLSLKSARNTFKDTWSANWNECHVMYQLFVAIKLVASALLTSCMNCSYNALVPFLEDPTLSSYIACPWFIMPICHVIDRITSKVDLRYEKCSLILPSRKVQIEQ